AGRTRISWNCTTAAGSCTRSPTGATTTCGAISTATTCRITRCGTKATYRSGTCTPRVAGNRACATRTRVFSDCSANAACIREPQDNLLRSAACAPAVLALRRQDAGVNIRAANGPKGEPQDAASNAHVLTRTLH